MTATILDWSTLAWIAGLVVFAVLFWLSNTVRYLPNTRVGVVERLWSFRGSLEQGLIALAGEAGFQPGVLRGGWHVFPPFQYRVHVVPLVTIPQGKIGYVFARDGAMLPPTQTLASNAGTAEFTDAAAFLRQGGQRGPQRRVLREGTYAVNLAQFVVIAVDGIHFLSLSAEEDRLFHGMAGVLSERAGFEPVVITDDAVGIVTVHDGPSLAQGEVVAPTVGDRVDDPERYHNNFQDPERFLAAGGMRGRQLQVLVEGTYYVNRLFATVELIPKTVVEVGNVGVVVSYSGRVGKDLSGEGYRHGELVQSGERGVWSEPLLPGKYAFNTYAGKVLAVPTTNFILKWVKGETGAHRYDENLSEVALITKDAFEPTLPLSVVVHIDYKKAPLVIQQFGDVKRLVEQTLDPMVSAYFKNVGQTRTLIQLIQDRSEIQRIAGDEMKAKFAGYSLELKEVLIGTPASQPNDRAIESILVQLRSRQIAEEQVETYSRQEKAAVKERELREAEARAKQQTAITESELSITVQSNQGKADYQRSVQQASQIRALAEAEADKIEATGRGEAARIKRLAEAEAEKAAKVGVAQALAIEEQVRAYGGPQLQLTQQVLTRFAEAVEQARVDVVPKIVVGGAAGAGGASSLFESLLAVLLSERLGEKLGAPAEPRDPATQAYRESLRKGATGTLPGEGGGT
ncbi:MAG TPA: SPFH domain-containing protein [Anaeromyxobacter sp.]|nr:SPFH domain-containing protein [Anaeromyxobacter sp.]